MGRATRVYKDSGGNREVVASGGILRIETGGILQAGTADLSPVELAVLDGLPASLSFTAAAGATNVCEVTIAVKDAAGTTIAKPFNLDVWLSDAATGVGLTATTASGTVQAKTASGTVMSTYTAKKALYVQTKADGTFVLEITDSAKTGFYVCATVPATGATKVSAQLAADKYGA